MAASLVRGRSILVRAERDGTLRTVDDGAFYQEEGVIREVGPYQELKARHEDAEEVGDGRQLLLPGLINAHHHGRGLTPLQLGVADDFLESWLVGSFALPPVPRYLDTLYCNLRLLEGGVTTVVHSHSAFNVAGMEEEVEAMLQAYRETGLRVVFALRARDRQHFVYQEDQLFLQGLPGGLREELGQRLAASALSSEAYFTLFRTLLRRHDRGRQGKVRLFFGPLAPQWCTEELLREMVRRAEEYDVGIHTHLLETVYQKQWAWRSYGKSLVAHLEEIGFLRPRVSLAHCVWLTREDIARLAVAGASVCHNPSSNLRLKSGIAPVNALLARGVNVGLGIDSHALNDDDDFLQEMRLCRNLHRPPGLETPELSVGQVLHLATLGAAKAALWEGSLGSLEPGKRADAVLVNLDRILAPYLSPAIGLWETFLHRGKRSDVDTVIINGEVVVRQGRAEGFDREKIAAELGQALEQGAAAPSLARQRRLAEELRQHVRAFYQAWHQGFGEPHYRHNSAT